MDRISAVRTLNEVIQAGVTRTAIANRLKIHPSQVSRIAAGDFKRLDGHALRVCKYAQMMAARVSPARALLGDVGELEAKLVRLAQVNPDAATALSEMLDALINLDERPLRVAEP